ncbi:MAG TPA: hypothetical protein VH253_14475 [Phycisphaerae bacterium]|nr:hypothetical protein [Phycisphaerae bacterium]
MRRFLTMGVLLACIAGCGPDWNAVTNRLRQQTIDQQKQLKQDQVELGNRQATIDNLRQRLQGNQPPLQTLSDQRLNELITATQLEIQSQTNSWRPDEAKGLTCFRVFIRTLTDGKYSLPATGDLTIEALQLSSPPAAPRRLGVWKFTPAEMKAHWYGGLGTNHFAFNCPWTDPPTQPDVLFRATFTDALTGKTMAAELQKKVTLPPSGSAPSPGTRP